DPGDFYSEFEQGAWDVVKPNGNGPVSIDVGKKSVFAYDKLSQLESGLWEGLYPSQSEADSALCWYLAEEYGNDPVLIDKAFRSSGLMRDKWDRITTGRRTYGEITISHVIDKRRKDSNAEGWKNSLIVNKQG